MPVDELAAVMPDEVWRGLVLRAGEQTAAATLARYATR
jgi:hypothetical protein